MVQLRAFFCADMSLCATPLKAMLFGSTLQTICHKSELIILGSSNSSCLIANKFNLEVDASAVICQFHHITRLNDNARERT